MKALIVAGNPHEGQALKEGFELSGFDVDFQKSALFALTLVERNRPDVVVCSQELEDMSGLEFYEMMRSDPKLSLVPILLLTNTKPDNVGDFDMVLPNGIKSAEVVRSAYKLTLELTRKTMEAPAPGVIQRSSINGQLGDVSLFELAQWLAKSAKTGRLTIDLVSEQGNWLFIKGQLVHAEYNGQRGEDAVLRMMLQAENKKQGRFDFEPLRESDFGSEPKTISKSTDQLLLSLAVEMDHRLQDLN